MNKTSISSLSAIASVMFSALFMAACQRDIAEGRPVFGKRAADGMISVVVNIARDAATTRSAIFGEGAESTIRDMNIWVYAPDGSLTDNLYADGLSISGTGTVSYTTYGDPESDVVYLANLGRKVTAPAEYGDSTTFRRTFSSASFSSNAIPYVGCTSGFAPVTLYKAMARIRVSVTLDQSLAAYGYTLGNNAKVTSLRLCNTANTMGITPSDAIVSMQNFRSALSSQVDASGDAASEADLSNLNAGGAVALYCLPNNADAPYTVNYYANNVIAGVFDAPEENVTYVEMKVFREAGALGTSCTNTYRFYVADGDYGTGTVGVRGACSYNVAVMLGTGGASFVWRREDYRMDNPSEFTPGIAVTLSFKDPLCVPPGTTFSLDASSSVTNDGTFVINTSGGGGVTVTAISSGGSTLYVKNPAGDVTGTIPVYSSWPDVSVSPVTGVDILGAEKALTLSALPLPCEMFDYDALTKTSAFWNSNYTLSAMPLTGTAHANGYNPDSFLGAEIDAGAGTSISPVVYVKDLSSKGSIDYKSWRSATYTYRLNFKGGFSSADATVEVVDINLEPYSSPGSLYESGYTYADISGISDRNAAWAPKQTIGVSDVCVEVVSGTTFRSNLVIPVIAGSQLHSLSGGSTIYTGSGGTHYRVYVGSTAVGDSYATKSGNSIVIDRNGIGYSQIISEGNGIFLRANNAHSNEIAEEQLGYYKKLTYRADTPPSVLMSQVEDPYSNNYSCTLVFMKEPQYHPSWTFTGRYCPQYAEFASFAGGVMSPCRDYGNIWPGETDNYIYSHFAWHLGDNVNGTNASRYSDGCWLVTISRIEQNAESTSRLANALDAEAHCLKDYIIAQPKADDGAWLQHASGTDGYDGTYRLSAHDYGIKVGTTVYVGPWDCQSTWKWNSLSKGELPDRIAECLPETGLYQLNSSEPVWYKYVYRTDW